MDILSIEGKTIKINKNSITCKGENGKTCGIVQGTTKFNDLQANKQILFSKALRVSGLWGSKHALMDNVLFYENRLFHIASIKKLEHYREFDPDKYADIANIVENAEQNGIYTLLCYM